MTNTTPSQQTHQEQQKKRRYECPIVKRVALTLNEPVLGVCYVSSGQFGTCASEVCELI